MSDAPSEPPPDVTVVGAGIVGICCALSLLERGVRVRVLDKAGPAEATSYGNAGVISPWSCVPQALPGVWRNVPGWLLDPLGPVSLRWHALPRMLPWALRFFRAGRPERVAEISAAMDALNRPNVDLYRRHLAGTGQEDLLQDSWYLLATRDPQGISEGSLGHSLRKTQGAPLEIVDGDTLREIEPALAPDYRAALVIKDQARAVQPSALGQALADKARGLGADLQRRTVRRLVPDEAGRWRLDCDEGPVVASTLVIAAGPWSLSLLAPLGITLPLAYERGYHLEFRDPGVTLKHSVMDADRKFVTSSMANGIRSAGTAEFADLEAAPNYRRATVLEGLTKQMLPELNTADTQPWMGTRPSFPDSLPCIAPLPGHANLFAAFGHSHYGLGMAPKTGQIVADLVTGTQPNIDLAPYSATRFG